MKKSKTVLFGLGCVGAVVGMLMVGGCKSAEDCRDGRAEDTGLSQEQEEVEVVNQPLTVSRNVDFIAIYNSSPENVNELLKANR